MTEIHDLDELRDHLRQHATLANVAIQSVDLRAIVLDQIDVDGACFLGCQLTDAQLCNVSHRGGLVFPNLGDLPFEPFRPLLYSSDDLFDDFKPSNPLSYCQTTDARIYQHYLATGKSQPTSIRESLARRLHDHAMTDAMHDFLSGYSADHVVAMMGGHSLRRDSDAYLQVAIASRRLAEQGYLMVSGGGPGAMEATHVGVWMAGRTDNELQRAVAQLADFGDATDDDTPDYRQKQWLANAMRVKEAFPPASDACVSLGIPTWHYGHEPPTPFATHIAKYFANSVREDGLVTIAEGGIVFAPGSFGTFQEVFQDAAQNHYATAPARVSPMVFFGAEFWTKTKPVFSLLKELARTSQLASRLALVDDVDSLVQFIVDHPPRTGEYGQWSFCEAFGG